jgi:hypothetical protein
VILYSYIFKILLYFLYFIPKSYIFPKLWERKNWIFNFEWKFHIKTWQIEAIRGLQDINVDTSIVFSWSCTLMWLFYCWIFLGIRFTWLHIYFNIVVFCGTFLAHLAYLGWKSGSPDTILKGGHPRTIPPKFGCNWSSGFWGED